MRGVEYGLLCENNVDLLFEGYEGLQTVSLE